MKKALLLLLSIACYISSHAIIRQERDFIRLRASKRLMCGGVKITFKNDIPYSPEDIICVAYKYNPAAHDKLEKRGQCLLAEFPQEGIKFDAPSYNKDIHYRIYFVLEESKKTIPPAEIIEKIIPIPEKLCVTLSLPYKPLYLRQTLTRGEKAAIIATAVIGTGALAYTLYQRDKSFKQDVQKAEKDLQSKPVKELAQVINGITGNDRQSQVKLRAAQKLYYNVALSLIRETLQNKLFTDYNDYLTNQVPKNTLPPMSLKQYAENYLKPDNIKEGNIKRAQESKNKASIIETQAYFDARAQLLQEIKPLDDNTVRKKLRSAPSAAEIEHELNKLMHEPSR